MGWRRQGLRGLQNVAIPVPSRLLREYCIVSTKEYTYSSNHAAALPFRTPRRKEYHAVLALLQLLSATNS
jgi:hypothetical protein